MVTRKDIKLAIEQLNNPQKRSKKSLIRQLVSTLQLYISRGEFTLDGSIEEAILCLELAGYDVETF